jgi:hypothetical protein
MLWVRVKDGTFGIGMQGNDFYVLMYVHQTTLVYIPLAFFIRKRGTVDDPHPLIPDLMWMEDVLQNVFGFPAPRYDIIDKCAGSLATFAEGVKESWAAQSKVVCPEGEDTIGAYAAAKLALESIADGCTSAEIDAMTVYIANVQSGNATRLPAPFAADVAIPQDQLKDARKVFFSSWVDAHPTLVRALAQRVLSGLAEAKVAVAASPAKAGFIDAALENIQGFAWAIADNDGPVSAFFRSHVERWIRLCFFHAKKAIREWGYLASSMCLQCTN